MILRTGSRVASHRPGVAQPRGDPGAALDATGDGPWVALAPGASCGSPWGRSAGCHALPSPGPAAPVLVDGHPGDLSAR
jgi:hypothetical protein